MNIIRYKTPELSTFSRYDRLSPLRDLLDSVLLSSASSKGWVPALEVLEDVENVTVHLEAPGMKKDAFDISLEEDSLSISGERSAARTDSESFRSERQFGSFSRSISLPAPVKTDEVKAEYQDGILTVTLPKAEEAKPRKIKVSLD